MSEVKNVYTNEIPTYEEFKAKVRYEVYRIRGKYWSQRKIDKQMKEWEDVMKDSYLKIGEPIYVDKWGIKHGDDTSIKDQYKNCFDSCSMLVGDWICG